MTSEAPPVVRQGLLDTSVVVDLDHIPLELLPATMCVTAITLAELAAGPHAAGSTEVRARRQELLQRVESLFEVLPFDASAARAYGRVFAATQLAGRKPRGAKAVDLLIAAVALANGLPFFTRNPRDFQHLRSIGLELHSI